MNYSNDLKPFYEQFQTFLISIMFLRLLIQQLNEGILIFYLHKDKEISLTFDRLLSSFVPEKNSKTKWT